MKKKKGTKKSPFPPAFPPVLLCMGHPHIWRTDHSHSNEARASEEERVKEKKENKEHKKKLFDVLNIFNISRRFCM
jgi:hypothetical protein